MHYFDHDTSASGDDKITALRLAHGGAAVDAYWSLLELIYNDERPLNLVDNPLLTNAVSHRLAIGSDELLNWVETMVSLGLFDTADDDKNAITSKRAMEHIKKYRDKVEKARLNGQKGGRKTNKKTDSKANAKRAVDLSESDAKAIRNRTRGIGSHKENQIPTASAGAAVASATPPPLPNGWEKTGNICPHANCFEHLIRDCSTGALWCPRCQSGELSMMGVVA